MDLSKVVALAGVRSRHSLCSNHTHFRAYTNQRCRAISHLCHLKYVRLEQAEEAEQFRLLGGAQNRINEPTAVVYLRFCRRVITTATVGPTGEVSRCRQEALLLETGHRVVIRSG